MKQSKWAKLIQDNDEEVTYVLPLYKEQPSWHETLPQIPEWPKPVPKGYKPDPIPGFHYSPETPAPKSQKTLELEKPLVNVWRKKDPKDFNFMEMLLKAYPPSGVKEGI